MALRVSSNYFTTKDNSISDKLEGVYALMTDLSRMTSCRNEAVFDEQTTDTIYAAKRWLNAFLDAFAQVDCDTYEMLEEKTS